MAVLTPNALAQRWQISPKTVINLIVRGELAGLRVGKQWRIDEAAAASYERAHGPAGTDARHRDTGVAS